MARITNNQKRYISSLTEDLSESQFSQVVEATSQAEKQTFRKGRAAPKRTKAQMISTLSSSTASEVIELLRTPEFIDAVILLDQDAQRTSRNNRARGRNSARNGGNGGNGSKARTARITRSGDSAHKGKEQGGNMPKQKKRSKKASKQQEHIPFSDADVSRLKLDKLQKWADDHNESAVRVLDHRDARDSRTAPLDIAEIT